MVIFSKLEIFSFPHNGITADIPSARKLTWLYKWISGEFESKSSVKVWIITLWLSLFVLEPFPSSPPNDWHTGRWQVVYPVQKVHGVRRIQAAPGCPIGSTSSQFFLDKSLCSVQVSWYPFFGFKMKLRLVESLKRCRILRYRVGNTEHGRLSLSDFSMLTCFVLTDFNRPTAAASKRSPKAAKALISSNIW